MPAFFDNKTIFPSAEEKLISSVKIYAQPSVTSIYIDGHRIKQFEGDGQIELGTGSELNGKKVRIHTSVQDKNDNSDDIRVEHLLYANTKVVVNRKVNTTAAEEGDIFDVFTDISIYSL